MLSGLLVKLVYFSDKENPLYRKILYYRKNYRKIESGSFGSSKNIEKTKSGSNCMNSDNK